MKKNHNQFDLPKTQKTSKRTNRVPLVLMIILALSAAGIISSLSYKTSIDNHNHEYAHLSSKLHTYLLKIVQTSSNSELGNSATFNKLLASKTGFSTTLNQLKKAKESPLLVITSDEKNLDELTDITTKWDEMRNDIQTILDSQKLISLTREFVNAVNIELPGIISSSEQLLTQILRKQPDSSLIIIASQQLLLGQRILSNVNLVGGYDKNTATHIEILQEDVKTFQNNLENMLKGNSKIGIVKIKRRSLQKEVKDLIFAFETIAELINRTSNNATQITQILTATDNILGNADDLLSRINILIDAYHSNSAEQKKIESILYSLLAVAALAFVALFISLARANRSQYINGPENNKDTVNAIIKLQNEIAPIAKGDLTINATVGKGITESLSRTVNISINSLRQLVRNIDIMAHQVSETAEETQTMAIQLAKASNTQAQQLGNVTDNINNMLHSFKRVTKQAEESKQLANKAVEMAEQGGQSVRNTLHAMQTITDDIHHTSSSVKRLGESSQEIGNIVELINDIADQTNILALNAAIKASVAGKSGQDFTSVADEVQQLAERVTQATKKIESLVNSIQLDTSQAITSMEQSYTDVIHGSKLASTAGDALLRIETVSAHLAEFIHDVANATIDLTETSQEISREMNSIKKVTGQNLAGTKQTAALTGKLAELANVQQTTVKGFKLPEAVS